MTAKTATNLQLPARLIIYKKSASNRWVESLTGRFLSRHRRTPQPWAPSRTIDLGGSTRQCVLDPVLFTGRRPESRSFWRSRRRREKSACIDQRFRHPRAISEREARWGSMPDQLHGPVRRSAQQAWPAGPTPQVRRPSASVRRCEMYWIPVFYGTLSSVTDYS